jgi:hypothetical protein
MAAVPAAEFNGMIGEWRDRIEGENERVTINLLDAGDRHVRGTFGTGEAWAKFCEAPPLEGRVVPMRQAVSPRQRWTIANLHGLTYNGPRHI